MERMPTIHARPRRWGAVPFLLLAGVLVGLIAGCGGGSTSVISTGFPAGNGTNSLVVNNLTLTATNLPAPVSFPPPVSLAAGDARLQTIRTFSGTGTLVPGTAFLLHSPSANFMFPSPITMTISYTGAGTAAPITLNIYYLDANGIFQPVVPTNGGYASIAGGASGSGTVTTTISAFQGQGVYAILAAAPPASPSLRAKSSGR